MKKIVRMLLCILTLLTILPMTVHADMGPKPSVVINFNDLEGKSYYVTLLSKVKSTGPYTALNIRDGAYVHYQKGDEDYDIFLKFAEYNDSDGYYFLQYFQDCTQNQQFKWTYYPPQVFKVLLYFPESDQYMISENSHERYAFNSYFSAKVSDTSLFIETDYDFTKETISFVVRVILTIIAELGIALLFGFRNKKQFQFIILVNVITQLVLNIALNIINYKAGVMAFVVFYILLEIVVFIIEAVVYHWYLNKFSSDQKLNWKPVIYALVANVLSFALGLGLSYLIPGIF